MDDPGWRGTWRFAIPLYGRLAIGRFKGVAVLRGLFVTFVSSMLLLAVMVAFVVDWRALRGTFVLISAVGITATLTILFLRQRSLDCASPEALAGSFRTTFFLMIGASEAVAVIGFVLAIATNNAWNYFLALPLSLIGFTLAAPDRGEIERRQHEVTTSGSSLSLLEVLEGDPPALS